MQEPWDQVLDLFYWLWNGNIYDDTILWPECLALLFDVYMFGFYVNIGLQSL